MSSLLLETVEENVPSSIAERNNISTRTPNIEQVAVVVVREGCMRKWFGTDNLRALWGMFVLNTAFAIAQMIAATIANSLSLFSDSGSMLVDSFAYGMNILMERRKNRIGIEAARLREVYTSIFSVLLLVGVTLFAFIDATIRLKRSDKKESKETVNGKIVFGFAFGNLVIDIVMCVNYCFQLRHRRRLTLKDQVMSETKEQLNMVSAFVHLFADTLRTLTSMVAGVLEETTDGNAISIDAIATFVVCCAILVAASFVLYESILQYKEYKQARHIAPILYQEIA
jgi:Co/Zn/Cd efflux system component